MAELANQFALSRPTISRHLKMLERAGLISKGREAQRRPRRLRTNPLAKAGAWLESYRQFWEGSFQRLDALPDQMKAKQKKRPRAKKGDQ